MNKKRNNIALWIVLGSVTLLGVGILVDIVGSVSIRSNESAIERIPIHVTSPLVPGMHTLVRWDIVETILNRPIGVMLRTQQSTVELTDATLFDRSASVLVPCNVPGGQASLQLMSMDDKALLGWIAVDVLPAGRDCAR